MTLFKYFFFMLTLIILQSCSNDVENSQSVYIKNLGVNFGQYDRTTGKAGDFIFSHSYAKIFLEFGNMVIEGRKNNVAFEYYVSADAQVMAIADGTVKWIRYQPETKDYEMWVTKGGMGFNGQGIDHIVNPTKSAGDTVTAGDFVGNPGPYNTAQNIGRTEIQINSTDDKSSECVFIHFDPELVEEYKNKVSRLMNDWEFFKFDKNIYDENNHVYPGCLSNSVLH